MDETTYLLSTPANAKRLMRSVAQANAGKVLVKVLNLGDDHSKRTVRIKNDNQKVQPKRRSR